MADSLRKRFDAARSSEAAWREFCAALEPGREMDKCVELAMFAGSNAGTHGISTDAGAAFRFALIWNETLTMQTSWSGDDDDYAPRYTCELSEGEYEGEGSGVTPAEAICRAILDMYHPDRPGEPPACILERGEHVHDGTCAGINWNAELNGAISYDTVIASLGEAHELEAR